MPLTRAFAGRWGWTRGPPRGYAVLVTEGRDHTMTTSPHRWTDLDAIDPAEWGYVGSFDSGATEGQFGTADAYEAVESSPVSRYPQRGQCDHCGAHIRYVAVVRHLPSGDVIAIGETCLSHRFDFTDRASRDLAALRRAAAAAREREAERARVAAAKVAFGEAHPAEAAILAEVHGAPEGRDQFLVDLAAKWDRWGDLSERQLPWVTRCVEREAERRERDAQEAADAETEVEAPEGRVVVTGTVLATKWQDSDFGGSLKMLVRAEDGNGGHYKVWSTVPAALDGEVKGQRIQFTATLEQSDRSECFAFAKRPSKARYL